MTDLTPGAATSEPATSPGAGPSSGAVDTPGTALVTGGTAGMGLAFARKLAAGGHDLVLVARDRARLEETAERLRREYAVGVEALPADLTDRTALARVEDRLTDVERPIDLLVNNAGFGLLNSFSDNELAAEQAQLDVLVVAPMRLMHAALRAMLPRGRGRILNVSSVSAFLPRGSYGAAKAYLNRLGAWAHHEYRPRGVTVTTLCPGFVRTEFHQRLGGSQDTAPGFLWLDADEVVTEALADLEAGRAFSIPSRRYRAIVRVSRLMPTGLMHRFQSLGR